MPRLFPGFAALNPGYIKGTTLKTPNSPRARRCFTIPPSQIFASRHSPRLPEGDHGQQTQPLQFPHHPAQIPGRLAGHALRHRHDRARHGQGAGRHQQRLVRRQHLQHASQRSGRRGEEGRGRGRPGRHALQHHRRVRRHLDGHRRHELLAAIARHHRRLHRNGDGRAVVRRQYLHPRLRQEHARLHHRDGAPEPPVADDLRRHHQARSLAREDARHRLGLPELWRVHRRQDRRAAASGHRQAFLPRRRRLRRHVHRQHHGLGDRSAGHEPALQFLQSGGRSGQDRGMPRRRRGDPASAGDRSQAARHHDARRVRKRDGHRHGAGRLHQCGAAPDRDGARRRCAARHR